MKSDVSAPQLVICATTWSMIGYPSPKREWSMEEKLRAIRTAGFDGVCAYITPEMATAARKLGLRLMSGFDAKSVADALPRLRAHWVEPRITVQVGFIEWTTHGKLRHPRLLAVVENDHSS